MLHCVDFCIIATWLNKHRLQTAFSRISSFYKLNLSQFTMTKSNNPPRLMERRGKSNGVTTSQRRKASSKRCHLYLPKMYLHDLRHPERQNPKFKTRLQTGLTTRTRTLESNYYCPACFCVVFPGGSGVFASLATS
jgi:hypothetical protein